MLADLNPRRDASRPDREQGPRPCWPASGPQATWGCAPADRPPHLAGISVLDARLKSNVGQIAALATESGTTLTSLYGISG